MIKLYQIAVDNNQDLSTRYDAVRMMLRYRQLDPKNHMKQIKENARQRKYNSMRKDWRVYA